MLAAALLSLCLSGNQMAPITGDSISLRVGHHFSRADAHARVQMLLDYWAQRFGVTMVWQGDRVWVNGTVVGVTFHSYLDVTDEAVIAQATDPGSMRNVARDYVSKKLRKYLNPQYAEP